MQLHTTADQILSYLHEVATELDPTGGQHVIVVVGGALLAVRGLRDSTMDIDTDSHLIGSAPPRASSLRTRPDVNVPSRFTSAALFIDDVTGTIVNGCLIQPFAFCRSADMSGADLSGANLSNWSTNSTTICPGGNSGPCW